MEHHCGVYGVCDVFTNNYLVPCLSQLQHRGSESAGICYVDSRNKKIILHKKLGLVNHVFDGFRFGCISQLAIGHVRYSTRKGKSLEEREASCQPFIGYIGEEQFALAHNGNVPNITGLVEEYGIDPTLDSDTLILVKFLEKIYEKYKNWEETLIFMMNRVPGAYCFVVLTKNKLYALRDRFGIRPLCLGHRDRGGFVVASETVALGDHKFLRDVKPGEIVALFPSNGQFKLETVYQNKNTSPQFCALEYIYFMSYKSTSVTGKRPKEFSRTVENIRYQLGFSLGQSERFINLSNKITVPVPNSSLPSGKGFADGANIPYGEFIIRNPDILRTFILPTQEERREACEQKFAFLLDEIAGKEIYLVDDSIVRGTTMRVIIKKLKEAGALAIHLRIISPPVISPCYYGIDMSTREELLAYNKNINEISRELGADSVKYLDLDKMKEIMGEPVCTSCFTGQYDSRLLDW